MNGLISRDETNILKGIAISIIIIQHIGQAFHISAVNPLGPIGVFLFLFISGYGLMCSYEKNGLKHYISKRILKVYAPYVSAVILFLLLKKIIGNSISLKEAVEYLVLKKLPQGSYWYLILMFYWYIVFFIIARIIKNIKISIPIMMIASFVIICTQGFSRVYMWQFVSFPLGCIIGAYQQESKTLFEKINGIKKAVFLIIITFILIGVKKTPYVELNELGVIDTVLQIVITLIVSMVIIVNCSKIREKINNLILFKIIGSYSYSLYLAHVIPLDFLRKGANGKVFLEYILVVLICTVIINYVEAIFDKVLINLRRKI